MHPSSDLDTGSGQGPWRASRQESAALTLHPACAGVLSAFSPEGQGVMTPPPCKNQDQTGTWLWGVVGKPFWGK